MFTRNRHANTVVTILLGFSLLAAGGCSTLKSMFGTPKYDGPMPSSPEPPPPAQQAPPVKSGDPAQELRTARTMIMVGRYEPAHKVLTNLTTGAPLPGISDEALFHLGIVTLKLDEESAGYQRSRQIFDQLARNYPDSVWGTEALLLSGLLVELEQSEVSLDKTRRQMKTLRDSNTSLSRENKELRLNIEKLKTIDLELEHKSRR